MPWGSRRELCTARGHWQEAVDCSDDCGALTPEGDGMGPGTRMSHHSSFVIANGVGPGVDERSGASYPMRPRQSPKRVSELSHYDSLPRPDSARPRVYFCWWFWRMCTVACPR